VFDYRQRDLNCALRVPGNGRVPNRLSYHLPMFLPCSYLLKPVAWAVLCLRRIKVVHDILHPRADLLLSLQALATEPALPS
ncbi:hypothetical protein, partial [Rhizobium leguminosarum]|uniref:hypothetical protein n=1 Tax=Rhizobium leguminosarum TaxID=384 RepID=UPI001C919E93